MPRGVLPRLPYSATLGSHASRVFMQVPFLYQVTPSKWHQPAAAMNSVASPLVSLLLGYPFQRQPNKQGRFPGNVPHV